MKKVIISDMETSKVGPKFKGFFKPRPTETETVSERKPEESGSKAKGFFKTVANEETAGSALLGLLLYSLMIFFLPFFGFLKILFFHSHLISVSLSLFHNSLWTKCYPPFSNFIGIWGF